MIRNVLFDLDDTLFDFHKAEKIALTKTLVHFGIDPTEETLALYSTINAAHWKRPLFYARRARAARGALQKV